MTIAVVKCYYLKKFGFNVIAFDTFSNTKTTNLPIIIIFWILMRARNSSISTWGKSQKSGVMSFSDKSIVHVNGATLHIWVGLFQIEAKISELLLTAFFYFFSNMFIA